MKKTMKGYKLFEMNKKGELFPLFINKNTPTPVGVWVAAENHPTKGYAKRPGWHVGTIPDAPWLKGYDGTETGLFRSRWKTGKRVWCEVEFCTTHNYCEEIKHLPKRCFEDKIPEDGFYIFREAGKGDWYISSSLKVVKVLNDAERRSILDRMGYDEAAAYAPYKAAFEKKGGTKYV